MSAADPLSVVLGGTGRIGSAVAAALLRDNRRVRIVTRAPLRGEPWAARGAEVAVADLLDPVASEEALRADGAVRVFALNPPAPVTVDTDAVEHRTGDAIVAALSRATVERVVALSTYGARAGDRIGDLGTLHRFETALGTLDVPVAVVRAAYLFSNFDGLLEPVRADGVLPTMLRADRPIPMVAPADVGAEAARALLADEAPEGVVHVEGPARWSPDDAAAAFAAALDRTVRTVRTPREQWRSAFLGLGFSPEAAESYAGMTALVDEEEPRTDGEPVRGSTTLQAHVTALAASSPDGASSG